MTYKAIEKTYIKIIVKKSEIVSHNYPTVTTGAELFKIKDRYAGAPA
jgi:hypothetical protein